MKDDYILILDSGIGGRSILDSALGRFTHERFVYYKDSAHFPYGRRSKTELQNILYNTITEVMGRFSIKLVVLACNTATICALSYLRSKLKVPILGITPCDIPLDDNVIIFCTPLTAKHIDTQCRVVALPRLATQIEKYYDNEDIMNKIIYRTFAPYDGQSIILGCTHYLLIYDQIKRLFPHIVLLDNREKLLNDIEYILVKSKINRNSGDVELIELES